MFRIRSPRLIARAVAVIAVTGALAIGPGLIGTNSANAAPAGATKVDQCGSQGTEWVPDRGPGFDFADPCRRHDTCYGTQPYGRSDAGRKACDDDFLRNARQSCSARNGTWTPTNAACRNVAADYYSGLRWFGGKAFYRVKPKNPTVTVGPPKQIHPGGHSGGGAVGGGGTIIGGSSGTPNPQVDVGEPKQVHTSSK